MHLPMRELPQGNLLPMGTVFETMETIRTSRRRSFSREDYHRMGHAGVFRADERVELLDGEILVMNPQGPAHGGAITRIEELLHARLHSVALIRTQLPVVLADDSEPEPDFAVVKHRADYYSDSHPTVDDIHLLMEVMQSSADTDRRRKLPSYAPCGVPEVWLIDLATRSIEVHTKPAGSTYHNQETIDDPRTAIPTGISSDIQLSIEELLGPSSS